MKDKIKLEIERLRQEQKPFDYSAEQVEIKSLEDKIQPLIDRQMKKKPMFDEYESRIKELEHVLLVLEQFNEEEEEIEEPLEEDGAEDIPETEEREEASSQEEEDLEAPLEEDSELIIEEDNETVVEEGGEV